MLTLSDWIRLVSLCILALSGVTLGAFCQAGPAPSVFIAPEGAPKAEPGPYAVVTEAAFGAPGLRTFRPASLDSFPQRDKMPVIVWGNGGCMMDAPAYAGFLTTIASHGFLVITTVRAESDGG
jgi:hypothetical protein